MSLTAYNMEVGCFCMAGKNKFCPYHCMTVPLNINISLQMSDEPFCQISPRSHMSFLSFLSLCQKTKYAKSHCRQLVSDRADCLKYLIETFFRGLFCSTYILCEQALRYSQPTGDCRGVKFRMCDKQVIQGGGSLLTEESLKAQILVKLHPMNPVMACCKVGPLLLCCPLQPWVIGEFLTSFPSVRCTYPYCGVSKPYLFYLNTFHIYIILLY